MGFKLIAWIFLVILLVSVPSYADQFSLGLATRFDWWSIEKRQWAHWPLPFDSGTEWSAVLLEEGSAPIGVMLGPEFSYLHGKFSFTGKILFAADRVFDVTLHASSIDPLLEPSKLSGQSKRTCSAMDIMYGKRFSGLLGYRRLDVKVQSGKAVSLRITPSQMRLLDSQ